MDRMSRILYELRCEHQISQMQLADRTGVSQSTIAKIELGRNEATASTIRRLADYFEVSSEYLLGRTNEFGNVVEQKPRFHTTHDEEELVLKFRQLSPVSQITIRRLIDSVLKGEQKN